ncbi:hypothetical protein BaRGS_00016923 [Batillaria attramentaria]|uniref:Uncharacterized protein n=1 Tax=Batillaria attramentaria TaxID=370345 RepID=A0ABD0KYL5_9CAEN
MDDRSRVTCTARQVCMGVQQRVIAFRLAGYCMWIKWGGVWIKWQSVMMAWNGSTASLITVPTLATSEPGRWWDCTAERGATPFCEVDCLTGPQPGIKPPTYPGDEGQPRFQASTETLTRAGKTNAAGAEEHR